MRAADDAIAFGVQISILAPCHGHSADVRAGIAPGMQRTALPHDQYRIAPLSERIEAARIAIGNFIEAAQAHAGARHDYSAAPGLNAPTRVPAGHRATTWHAVETRIAVKNRR